MKDGVSWVVLLLLLGTLIWIATPRRLQFEAQFRPASFSNSQTSGRVHSRSAAPKKPQAAVESDPDSDAEMESELKTARSGSRVNASDTEPSSDPESTGNLTPSVALENIRGIFRNFSSRFGGNPVGNNGEITRTLNGDNPGQIVFLNRDDGVRIDERGELVDTWGTPYFFHQLSGTKMEIHSAGPDRRMWSPDDLVIR